MQVPSFDPLKLVQKLSSKCSLPAGAGGGFDWFSLGRSCGVCFNSVPERVSFLAGPLDAELPDRKKAARERKKREPGPKVDEVELKHVKAPGDGGDEDEDDTAADKANRLSACEKNLKDMKKVLNKKTTKSNAADTSGTHFLLNPKSFTQSVENIFAFSFLVKKGEAAIGIRENPGLGETRGLYVAPRVLSADAPTQAKQSVVSFTMRDWKRLCNGYGIEEGDLPNRPAKFQRQDK
jgi:hypothetical protein